MTDKPNIIIEWAKLAGVVENRYGETNKSEPTQAYKDNGSLDGELSLQHFNYMLNGLGLWSAFTNDLVQVSDGFGAGVMLDGHFSFIFAFDTTNLSHHIMAYGYKPDANIGQTHTLQSTNLHIGSLTASGDVPITNATESNVKLFCLNFKV